MAYGNVVSFDDRVQLVASNELMFADSITGEQVIWEKEKQFAIQALQANDYLANIAMQSPATMQNAIINIASIGISLNPALKHAYLVPRKGGVCLDISYMGLLHLAQSSGVILWGQSKLVYSNDTYENIGIDKAPLHKANPFGDRGDVVGAYCTVKTVDGDFLTEEMSIKEIHDIRGRSEAFKKGNGPWKTDEGEMTRKTVVKRAYKYWPKCERLGEAINMLNDNGEGFAKDFVEIDQDTYAEERASSLDDLAQEVASACVNMDAAEQLDDLEGLYKAIARKVKSANAEKFMIGLVRSKDKNKARLAEIN